LVLRSRSEIVRMRYMVLYPVLAAKKSVLIIMFSNGESGVLTSFPATDGGRLYAL